MLQNSLLFVPGSSTNLLGSGGFGAVYKATYRNRPVAVKIFSQKSAEINNTTPNYLLRLEVDIEESFLSVVFFRAVGRYHDGQPILQFIDPINSMLKDAFICVCAYVYAYILTWYLHVYLLH